MNKTSKEDFKLFKQECKKWMKIFGLTDWEPYFLHLSKKGSDALAGCSFNVVSRGATFHLNKNWADDVVSDKEIKITAFHEVTELLLGPLNYLSRERYVAVDQIEEATHAIIRRLENVAYPKLK